MTTTKESKCCKWCEDTDAVITLYSKSNDEILGFCSDACWSSYSEVIFSDRCPKCNEKANLLQVPASNKIDLLNEEFVNYCDNCLLKNVKQKQIIKPLPVKLTASIKQTPVTPSPQIVTVVPKVEKINVTNDSNSSPNQSVNSSASSAKRVRNLKNSNPYEIWGCFNWDNYLQLEGSTPAPADCFKQNQNPPVNEFELNMKLEAPDPRLNYVNQLICPATISNIRDSMVFVSFDGYKGAFDYWCRFDSRDLFPVGWCERSQHPLQMPGNKDLKIDSNKLSVNYIVNISYQTLKVKNSRSSLINNSTSVNSNKNSMSASNMESNFSNDSDNNADAVKSTPNSTNNSGDGNSILTTITTTTTPKTTTTTTVQSNTSLINQKQSPSVVTNSSSTLANKINASAKATNTAITLTAAQNNSSTILKSNILKAPIISSTPINKSSSQTPYPSFSSIKALLLDKNKHPTTTKVISSQITGGSVESLKRINGVMNKSVNKSSSLINHSSSNHDSNSTSNQPNQTRNDTSKHPLVTVHLNLNCNPGEYINIQEYKKLTSKCNSKIGPSQLNKTMKEILQLIVNSCNLTKKVQILEMIRPGNGSFEVDTGMVENNVEKKIKLPHFNRASAFWNYLNNFLGGLKCCKNLVSITPIECSDCVNNRIESHSNNSNKMQLNKQQVQIKQSINKPKINHSTPVNNLKPITLVQKNSTVLNSTQKHPPLPSPSSSIANNQPSQIKRKSEDLVTNSSKIAKTNGHHPLPSIDTSESTLSDPNNWSTDDVIKFLKMNDESLDFSELFKAHEIDGKAFLLLDSEMLMKYMKIKLGPALKIASIIDQLKKDQIN